MGKRAASTTPRSFETTRWSEIHAARTSTPMHRQAVLEELARRYWGPVYGFLRASGYQDAEATDTAQDFFAEVVLGRALFDRADEHRGRFRTYLLHCLKNFARERARRDRAKKRAPERAPIPLHCRESGWGENSLQVEDRSVSPEQYFQRQWAVELLQNVLDRLRAGCLDAGLRTHLMVYEERVIRPALEGSEPTDLEVLAERHQLTIRQISNRCATIRRRFRTLLRAEVGQTLDGDGDVDDEIRTLMATLRTSR